MEQGRSTRTPGRKLAAIAVAVACLLGAPAAARAATVVTPQQSGVLQISGGAEVNGFALRSGDGEPQLFIVQEAPTGFPDPAGLELAANALGCVDGSALLIVCDAGQVTHIQLNLGDERDYVDASGLARGGGLTADLGPGDDVFTGGPLHEQVSDGRGADRVAADSIIQPDAPDAAVTDGGDVLDGGTISYAARRRDAGVTVTLDDIADDGAPGERDRVHGTGVNGTQYADVITGSAANEVLDGRSGDDTIDGRSGDDALIGGSGSDTITGGDGVDTVNADPAGSAGDDTLHMEDGQPDGRISCGRGRDAVIADLDLLDSLLEPLGIVIPDLGCDDVIRLVPDRTAPTLTMTAKPAVSTEATDAAFAWTTDDAAATETCTLDGAAVECAGHAAHLAGLARGVHTFGVRSEDAAGNTGSATYTWTITAPPAAPGPTPTPEAKPAPSPATQPPAPVVTTPAKFTRPAGGRIRLEARNKVTLRFNCPKGCAGGAFQLRAKRSRVPVTVKAGQRTVRVTLPKALATAVRRAGKRGLKAALTSGGTTVASLRLYAKR